MTRISAGRDRNPKRGDATAELEVDIGVVVLVVVVVAISMASVLSILDEALGDLALVGG